jgi:hypothetical protein
MRRIERKNKKDATQEIKPRMSAQERFVYQITADVLWKIQCYCRETHRSLDDLQGLDDVAAIAQHSSGGNVPLSWLPE